MYDKLGTAWILEVGGLEHLFVRIYILSVRKAHPTDTKYLISFHKALVLINWLSKLSFSDYGSLASIVGIIIAYITLMKVGKIEDRFLLNVRVFEYVRELETFSSEMTHLLGKFGSNTQIINEKFALIDVKLRNIQRSATDDLLKDLKITRRSIKVFRGKTTIKFFSSTSNEMSAREIVTNINVVVEELKNQDKNRTLTR